MRLKARGQLLGVASDEWGGELNAKISETVGATPGRVEQR